MSDGGILLESVGNAQFVNGDDVDVQMRRPGPSGAVIGPVLDNSSSWYMSVGMALVMTVPFHLMVTKH